MNPRLRQVPSGSMRMFRLFGIDVYIHWIWLLFAVYEMQMRLGLYQNQMWNVAEYMTLFLLVLFHQFARALACRSVGGEVTAVVIQVFGHGSILNPPPRPGAILWTNVAGLLVYVLFVPVVAYLFYLNHVEAWAMNHPDAHQYLVMIAILTGVLLFFSLLPVYPYEGGMILHALLWFVIGRAASLTVVSFLGLVAGVGVIALLIYFGQFSYWLAIVAFFIVLRCIDGFRTAFRLAKLARAPRHDNFACPTCRQRPLLGEHWRCDECGHAFDTFLEGALCPSCGKEFHETNCPECGRKNPLKDWFALGQGKRREEIGE